MVGRVFRLLLTSKISGANFRDCISGSIISHSLSVTLTPVNTNNRQQVPVRLHFGTSR